MACRSATVVSALTPAKNFKIKTFVTAYCQRFALLLRVVICMKEMRLSLYAKALYRVECANGQSGVRSRCHQAPPCYQHHSRQRVKEEKLNRVQLLHNGTLPCT